MWCLWCCCIKERAKSFVGDADTQTDRQTQGKIHKTASSQAQIESHGIDKGDKDTGRKKVIIQICLHSIKLHQVEVILNLFFLTGHRALLVAGSLSLMHPNQHIYHKYWSLTCLPMSQTSGLCHCFSIQPVLWRRIFIEELSQIWGLENACVPSRWEYIFSDNNAGMEEIQAVVKSCP